jgi:hypothetical protein
MCFEGIAVLIVLLCSDLDLKYKVWIIFVYMSHGHCQNGLVYKYDL